VKAHLRSPTAMQRIGWIVFGLITLLCVTTLSAEQRSGTFNIRDFGATGDGVTSDTKAINEALDACGKAGGGQVLVPAGNYVCGTLHLRSHVQLFVATGATILGTTNLAEYQQPSIPDTMPEARWGEWHRALIVGENLEDFGIAGEGTIDGRRVFDPTGEEHRRGPHTIVVVNCRGFSIRDISIVESSNYAIFFQVTDDVEIRNVKITGGWDGVHFRGSPDRWCHNVNILGCRFYTGDDSIAGRYWDNVVIDNCILNSSCNGVRLIGPARKLIITHSLFYGPGQGVHHSSNRSNMLSGIILQPGAWDKTQGILDDVLLADNTMHNVASPVTIWTKNGNPVGRVTISGLNATGVYRAALSVESWADFPITNVVVRNATIEFSGGGKAEQTTQTVRPPGVDVRALPAWGVYARNVEQLTLEDVRLSLTASDARPAIFADRVQQLNLDRTKFPVTAGASPVITTNVPTLRIRESDVPATR
jgi:polygalacturonase